MKVRGDDRFPAKVILRPLAIGTGSGALVCFLLLLVMAAVMSAGTIPNAVVTPAALAAAAAAALTGGFIAARVSGERGLLYGAGCGFLMFLLVAAAGFTFLQDVRGSLLWIKLALMVGCGALGGIIGINLGQRRRRHS